jgi:ASC-1-like (ASCH) protein
MTRYLSLALGAEEPVFSQGIQQLEQASGLPSADIRLSTDLQQNMRRKIAELGLDPKDTTGPELYSALHERLKADDMRVRTILGITDESTTADVLASVHNLLAKAELHKMCFALKQPVAKRLLKKKVPKNVMKQLGYRSVESMLKHEPVAQLFAAAALCESPSWQKAFHDQFVSLHPSDFEVRPMQFYLPESKKWNDLAASYVPRVRHNVLTFKELGAVVVLPMNGRLEGLTMTMLLLSLHAMNDIRSYSSYIKLQQVKQRFGAMVRDAAYAEPKIAAELAGKPVLWKTIHRYYATFKEMYHPEIFEPHVQPEDLTWTHAEDILAKLEPALSFWQGTQHLLLMHDGQPVSCNMLDVALGFYNNLSFSDRIVHFLRDELWHELTLKYLNQDNLQSAVSRQLSYELVDDLPDLALAES